MQIMAISLLLCFVLASGHTHCGLTVFLEAFFLLVALRANTISALWYGKCVNDCAGEKQTKSFPFNQEMLFCLPCFGHLVYNTLSVVMDQFSLSPLAYFTSKALPP